VQAEKVTFLGAVPTVWIAIKELVEKEGFDISSIRMIPIGGSAAPRSLIELFDKKFGVQMMHAWGMNRDDADGHAGATQELHARLVRRGALRRPQQAGLRERGRRAAHRRRGRPRAAVGRPQHGRDPGAGALDHPLVLRQPGLGGSLHDDGWFRTGDIATIDPEGYIQITDRTKDVIKSGGEWISSVDLENMIMGHPKVLEAAVIAVPHPRWVERPLACVVPRAGMTLEPGEIVEHLRPLVARFQLPDEVVLVESIPKTGVGKFDKKVLRERFKNWSPRS
jgi:fatty-acyl-CoA synthase